MRMNPENRERAEAALAMWRGENPEVRVYDHDGQAILPYTDHGPSMFAFVCYYQHAIVFALDDPDKYAPGVIVTEEDMATPEAFRLKLSELRVAWDKKTEAQP